MTLAAEPGREVAKAPGRLSRAITRLFMKRATVMAIDDVADRFRLVTLEGDALKGVAWIPGQKVQIAMDSALVARTYTPIEWDAAVGRTRILGYAHGEGPGSVWLLGLEVGDEHDLFGPRRSLDLSAVSGPLALFGDETSIGLAFALLNQDRTRALACRFEVDDVEISGRVIAHLELDDALLFGRTPDDAQVEELEAGLDPLAAAGAAFALTGKAPTIQRLRQALKRRAIPARQIVSKAYWAPGKVGLD